MTPWPPLSCNFVTMTTTSTVLQCWPAGDGWWQCMTMFPCSTWKTQKKKKKKSSAAPPVSCAWRWPKRGIYILKKKHVCFLRFVQCVCCCRPPAAACSCCRRCSVAVMLSRTCQLEIKKTLLIIFLNIFPKKINCWLQSHSLHQNHSNEQVTTRWHHNVALLNKSESLNEVNVWLHMIMHPSIHSPIQPLFIHLPTYIHPSLYSQGVRVCWSLSQSSLCEGRVTFSTSGHNQGNLETHIPHTHVHTYWQSRGSHSPPSTCIFRIVGESWKTCIRIQKMGRTWREHANSGKPAISQTAGIAVCYWWTLASNTANNVLTIYIVCNYV